MSGGLATRDPAGAADALLETRLRTLQLIASISDEDLERVHSPLMSPLVWDLGHIAAFEDLWIAHRLGGRELLRGDLANVYDAFETPRAQRGELPHLRPGAARRYLADVRTRTLEVLADCGPADGKLLELVLRHEQQHNETMLQTIQLAQLRSYRGPRADDPRARAAPGSARRDPVLASLTGLELVEITEGPFELGADGQGFSYDNERPRHRAVVDGFRLGHVPVTNATYLSFVEGGGYERREWWSDEGWAWKEEYDISRPGGWTPDLRSEWRLKRFEPLHPCRPVIHVSWFEADAFARAHGARLPTEIEWERAATWDQERGISRSHPWGSDPPRAGLHANLDGGARGTEPVASHRAGVSPEGVLGLIGDVWEWTSSGFGGYPGFAPDPYPEYSEVFFDGRYRVLRGGSWATRPRIATPRFRNWDLPQRRQIFAGVRIAQDVP